MTEEKLQGLLLDIQSETNSKGESEIVLYVKTKQGVQAIRDKQFRPYFYITHTSVKAELEKELLNERFGDAEREARVLKVEEVKKKNAEKVLKLFFKNTTDLVIAREGIKKVESVVEKFEHDILFTKRYLIDNGLEPMNSIEIEFKEVEGKKELVNARVLGEELGIELNKTAFDLETQTSRGFSNPERDEILMASVVGPDANEVISYHPKLKGMKDIEWVKGEKELLEKLVQEIRKEKTDILVTYNGDGFDLPYLKERGKKLGVKIGLGFNGREPIARKKGIGSAVKLVGLQHLDVFQLMRLMARFGAVNLFKFDLESVIESIYGEKKEKVTAEEMHEIWETSEGLERMVKYNLEDSAQTLRLGEQFLPLGVELSKLVKQTLFDVTRASASILVEFLLMDKCFQTQTLVPNRPREFEVKQRRMNRYQGGFVKSPEPGLHENIAVLDFRSLHPTIMISHNVSPETVNCKCCKEKENLAPNGDWFCTKKPGFLSSILKELLDKRKAIKKEMVSLKKESKEHRELNARQHSLKIILNSFYGYLGYARSRWYSLESAKAITAWSRHYIQETALKADKAGFKTIYGDTDSVFLLVPKEKSFEEVEEFVKKVNSELPGEMELEFEGKFRRGIFVTKKEGGAAKKRYALIGFDGNLKIVGFEYVRRDWSKVAKQTQRKVIEAILREGNPKKAIDTVQETIKQLKEGKTPKKDLVIMTQLKKSISRYESIGPHVAAAKKAIQKGKRLGEGSMIEFIITKTGKSISDKAMLEEFVKEGDYDPDYYIEHQVLPAVIRIIQELGHGKDDLIHGGKQQTLSSFS